MSLIFLDGAKGIKYTDNSQEAAEGVRLMVKKWQPLNEKERAVALQFLSPDESRGVIEMLAALNPSVQAARRSHKSKTA